MTCNLTSVDQTESVGTEADWRSVISSGAINGVGVHHAILLDGDAPQAEWREGNLWIYNSTLNGIDPPPPDGTDN